MSRLRIAHFHTIYQDQRLVKTSSIDAYIGLRPVRAALAHINTGNITQQFIYRTRRHFGNFFFGQYYYIAVLLRQGYVQPIRQYGNIVQYNLLILLCPGTRAQQKHS
ncbi:hypothetical protein D3C72_1189990 [compost metagenome]